jgi:hypothetical protein
MGEEKKVIRKPDPSKRRDIHLVTFKKIELFLKEQIEPIFKSEMVRQLGVNYDSLNVALEVLPIKVEKDGRIQLKRRKK